MGKLIVEEFLYEEWTFDSEQELKESAKKTAIVCGDEIRHKENGIEIYNHHKMGVRWKGEVRKNEVRVNPSPSTDL